MPNLTQFLPSDISTKQYGNLPATVAAGASVVVDARGMRRISVLTGAASTALVSRVDSDTAGADSTDAAANASVAVASLLILLVDWPFFRVTATGGPVRVACV